MSSLTLSQLSWEAVATLLTGALAVAGAVAVGIRQVKVAARQAEIMARQTRLAELTLRHQLFERRMEVYTAVRAYLNELLVHAAPPDARHEVDIMAAMEKAHFLFRPGVQAAVEEVWQKGLAFRFLRAEMTRTYEMERHYGDGNPAKEEELLRWFSDRSETLREVFGEEVMLGE